MNIKEIINNEWWWPASSKTRFVIDHNESLKRIEAAVTERIKELEAQVPNVVKPKFNVGNFDCPDCEYRTLPEPCLYCPGCGAKLDWEGK